MAEDSKLKSESEEIAAIQETMSRLTWGRYEVVEPTAGFPSSRPVRWFLFCSEFEELTRVANASAIWDDEVSDIWIQSALIGTVSRWIEKEYGGRGTMQAEQTDYTSLEDVTVNQCLSKDFPLVAERLMNYIRIASDVSRTRYVLLRIVFKKAVAAIFLNCQIPAVGLDLAEKIKRIEAAVAAMNETFDSFNAYEASRAKKRSETVT